jgi:hypothetical protein
MGGLVVLRQRHSTLDRVLLWALGPPRLHARHQVHRSAFTDAALGRIARARGGSRNRRVPTGGLRRSGIHPGAVSRVALRLARSQAVRKSTIPKSCSGLTVVGWSSVRTAGGTANPPRPSASTPPWNHEKWCSCCGRTIASAAASGAAAGPDRRRRSGEVSSGRVPEWPHPRSTAVCELAPALGEGSGG